MPHLHTEIDSHQVRQKSPMGDSAQWARETTTGRQVGSYRMKNLGGSDLLELSEFSCSVVLFLQTACPLMRMPMHTFARECIQ